MMWAEKGCPGYLGKNRDRMYSEWDRLFGVGNWRLSWIFGACTDLDFLDMCALYEDAYHHFLEQHPDILESLIIYASNVFDDAPSNIYSRFNYSKQETPRTHVQDIAIRRCLMRRGMWFKGSELLQIRDKLGTHPLSVTLSPGQVPFHRPDCIVDELEPGWWERGSVESFYQSNRRLMVRVR